MAKRKIGKLYRVEWEDSAVATSAWIDAGSYMEPHPCTTVGFLIHESERGVNIAASQGETQHGAVTVIPKSAIRSMKRIR